MHKGSKKGAFQMEFGETLHNLRRSKKLTQTQLADIIKVSRASIAKYETCGVIPSIDIQKRIADLFNVSLDMLMGRKSEPQQIEKTEFHRVPLLGEIACGVPILAQQNIEEYVNAADNITCDFCLRCKGDSMSPTLNDGDLVFIRQQPDVYDGQIAAVQIDNEATLKHLYHLPNHTGIQLASDNAKYAPMLYTQDNCSEIVVLGLAVAYQRKII